MLALSGSLEVTIGDEHIEIVADGQQLTAHVTGKRYLRRALASLTAGKPMLRILAARLSQSGLTLTIRRDGNPIAQIGAGTQASVVGRLLDIPHFAIFPRERRP